MSSSIARSSHRTVAGTTATGPDMHPPRNSGALHALFARTLCDAERVVFLISDNALDEDSSRPAFYCVHSLSGASGTDFRELARLMPAVRFHGIQAPPKKMQDVEFGGSVESIADYYATALMKFQPTGPLLLGGWSAGAIIALQVAQSLRAREREVGLLAAIDAAPDNTSAGLGPWHPLYLLALAGNLPGWIIHENLIRKGMLRSLTRRALNKAMAFHEGKMARQTSGKRVNSHAVEGFMDLSRYPPAQRSFMKRLYDALLDYKPTEYTGSVVIYEATIKPLLRVPQVGKIWRKLAPQSAVVSVKGTHLSILREGYVNALAEDLRKRIARWSPENSVNNPRHNSENSINAMHSVMSAIGA